MIVQARMGSKRLPGKVLADLCGAPMLRWLLERVGRARRAGGVVVATTSEASDDPVADLCRTVGVECFRGHATDVLERVTGAARWVGAETVVRVSGDSPFLDGAPVDAVIEALGGGEVEVAENHRVRGWPIGTAAEALTRQTLEKIADEAREPRHREHVTLYAYEEDAGLAIKHVPPPHELEAPELRLCVDTVADLDRARRLCEALGPKRDFSLASIVRTARARPDLAA